MTIASSGELRGVFPVLQTPFDESGTIDEFTLRHEVDWVFACGAHGVTVAMVSEILRLEHNERKRLAEVVCDACKNKGPVVVAVGAESTKVAVSLARHAESVGAAAVMAIPPLSVVLPETPLIEYFGAIADAVEVPVVVQDASSYVGVPIPITVATALLDSYGQRIYFKPEAQPLGPRLTDLLRATAGEARVYDGSGGIALIDTYRRGIVGTMPGADVCWAVTRLWSLLENSDFDAAYRLSLPLSALIAMQTSLDSYVAVEKYLLYQQKVFQNTVCRGPVNYHLDATSRLQVDTYFDLLRVAHDYELPMPSR
jgi:dihydrodipicolinate synthase/N-acetylneuraminate lyase